jgi:hypothetical protein
MKRGFVMVMLLAIVAVLAVVLSALLVSNRQSSVVALRESEEIRARNIADQCLNKGVAVAVEHFRRRGGEFFDFDALLDPNGIPNDADDFVFSQAGGTVVVVPADAAGSPTEALYRYSFERIDPDGPGDAPPGACYLRFDDNADDSLPGYTAQTSNTGGVIEGPAAGGNVNNRDRDASIVVTAIGVYPAFTGIADADVYGRAHSRVTMKQYFSATSAPAVYGNGDIIIEGNTEFCGSGGVRGVDVTVNATSCICGDSFARTINGSNTSSTVSECGTTRCPRSTTLPGNQITAVPGLNPFTGDFPEQCLLYGETLGEEPSTFELADKVAGNARAPTGMPRLANELRLYLRDDGAVFAWDLRPNGSTDATIAAETPCDGFPGTGGSGAGAMGQWPPAASLSPANNGPKNAVCDPGDQCQNTTDPFDIEFCFTPATVDAFGTPVPAVITTTRCDGLGIDTNGNGTIEASELLTQSALQGNQAAKDARCVAAVGTNARCTTTGALLDRETCSLPSSPQLNCRDPNRNPFTVEPEATWTEMNTDITAFEAGVCFPQPNFGGAEPFRRGDGTPCAVADPNAHRLCWRMVAKLGAGGATADPRGVPEWEAGSSGKLQIADQRVPNMRVDSRLNPTGDAAAAPVGTRQVIVHHLMNVAPLGILPAPSIDFTGPGTWETESGWSQVNNGSRRLPTPAVVFAEAGGGFTFSNNTRVGGVSWAIDGDVTMPSGTVTLSSSEINIGNAAYNGGAAGCTIEDAASLAGTAWNGGARTGRPVLISSGSIFADASPLTLFGKVVATGRVRVGSPAGTACLVGGVSAGGVGPALTGCSAGACNQTAVCMTQRNAIIGSIFATGPGQRGDLLAPQGLFAQRGTGDNQTDELKISQLMAQGNICITGSSRVVGQVVSDRTGGEIRLGPDVLMVQSGEIGFGFATKKTTWTDNSW